ncbi:helix-turn-helix domain-containing protein [Streptomyces sp. NPDC005820]|uniref:AraC-like ligand-binding domain-containing protein n=1 Tax=Streptomyces sp. NPDC005820 TaxID=3157069 RepID=UPI0033DBEC5F
MTSTTHNAAGPDDRLERFQQLASETFAPLHIRSEHPESGGTLHDARPGEVLVTRITGGPCTVQRTRSLIGSGDRELLKVALYGRGRAGVEQDGRQCLPGPGDLVVYETARPYELRFWDPFDIVVLGIPRSLLGPHADRMTARTASAVPTDGGGRRLAAGLLRDAASDLDAIGGSAGPYLADALVSLVLSTLAERAVPAHAEGDLADRILAHCLGRLSDPRLSPESVARAHHVSVRYLHKTLSGRGVTLASWIRSNRLERIRRDLSDLDLADRSVAVIAARWGILDATHLSRALRSEFGRSAAEIRKAATAHQP